jgi:hypothetical protein
LAAISNLKKHYNNNNRRGLEIVGSQVAGKLGGDLQPLLFEAFSPGICETPMLGRYSPLYSLLFSPIAPISFYSTLLRAQPENPHLTLID